MHVLLDGQTPRFYGSVLESIFHADPARIGELVTVYDDFTSHGMETCWVAEKAGVQNKGDTLGDWEINYSLL